MRKRRRNSTSQQILITYLTDYITHDMLLSACHDMFGHDVIIGKNDWSIFMIFRYVNTTFTFYHATVETNDGKDNIYSISIANDGEHHQYLNDMMYHILSNYFRTYKRNGIPLKKMMTQIAN